jgi:alpha 1,2-mannosyltransferase
MEQRNIIYGGSLPYRHMCRFQSGFFWQQPILDNYDWYWRVVTTPYCTLLRSWTAFQRDFETDVKEPGTNHYCDIDYDVFEFMELNDYKYGFTMSLHEYRETIETLWDETKVPSNLLCSYLRSRTL